VVLVPAWDEVARVGAFWRVVVMSYSRALPEIGSPVQK
jgi:hypothetical protein